MRIAKKKGFAIVIAILVAMVLLVGCSLSKDQKTEGSDNILVVDKAGTYTLGDAYEEVIINVPDVQIEDGSVDSILVAESVGDGDVTLRNVKGNELTLEGGGPNSIIISGDSEIKSVFIERKDGVIRVLIEDNGVVESATVYEGSQDVVFEGNFGEIIIDASDIEVDIKGAEIDTLSVKGKGTTVRVDKKSSVKSATILEGADNSRTVFEGIVEKLTIEAKDCTVDINSTAEFIKIEDSVKNTTINVGENGSVGVINSTISFTLNGKGIINKVVTNSKSNIKGKATVEEVVLLTNSIPAANLGNTGATIKPASSVAKKEVVVAVSAISVEPKELTLTVGETATITATVEPDNATNKNVTWTTSDAEIATVDEDGNVTAVAAGTATITATTVDGGFTGSVQVAIGNVINITRNKGYQTIQEATEEIKDGDTLKLIADILTHEGITVDKNIIFDLNEKTITNSLDANKDGNENEIAIVVKSTVTVKNGTIITNNGTGGIQANGTSANLTIDGLTINQNGLNTKKIYNSTAVLAANEAKVTIISGDYTAETDAVLVKANGGTVIIEDGTFTAGRSAARNDAWGEATHSLTINGGKFKAEKENDSYALFSAGPNAETTVNGGIFNGEISSEYNHMIINDGTFNQTIFQGGGHQDYYIIYGGTFFDDLSGTLPENTKLIRAINTTDDKGYETIQEAIDKASKGDTITLLADASGDGVIAPENSSFTLDLGGHTYTVDGTLVGSTGTETNGFQLLKGSTITIKNGTITTPDETGAKILIQNYSNLTLDNVGLVGADVTQYVLSNNFGSTKLESGTTITAQDDNVAFDVYYWPKGGYPSVTVEIASDDVVITGNVEYAGDGSEGLAENAKLIIPTGYTLKAPAGFKWVAKDGKQVLVDTSTVAMIDDVPYNSLQAAITAASSGHNTIKLYDNIDTEGLQLQLNGKNVAFDLNGKSLKTAKLEVNNSTVVFRDSSDNGEGKLETDDSYGVINAVNSNVTIENGRFVSSYNKAGSSGYSNVIQVRNSELTINGGYFENTNNVGSYNRLIKVPSYSNTEQTTITINGGEFVSHRSYGYIVSGDSNANVEVVINGGKFDTTGNYSYLTNVKGSVVVNDCTYTATSNNTVFNIPEDSTVTVKGGTFSVTGDPELAGLIWHRKTNGWTNAKGTLMVDPVNPVKVNQATYSGFLADGATESAKDADGFYTITK